MVDTDEAFDILSAGDAFLDVMQQTLERMVREKDALDRGIEDIKKNIDRVRTILANAREGSTILTIIAHSALVTRLIRPSYRDVAGSGSRVRGIRPLSGMLETIPGLSREDSYHVYRRISRRYCHGPDKGYGVIGVVFTSATIMGEPDPARPVAAVFVVQRKLPTSVLGLLSLPAFVTVRLRGIGGTIEIAIPTDVIARL